jgi:hypothetical protein
MDIRNCSIESGGYLKMARHNEIVQVLRGMELRCLWNTTLSKKSRGVKILELKGNGGGRQIKLLDFWI